MDWLEAEIKAKKVDTEYLPLACRKDELDPTSQRKIGVSVYGEEDGWIDGYVDMWLDDPAKEHLSVLGEFGTGKTWFVLHYAWAALQRYREAKRRGTERPRIPVVVPLRDYAKAVSVESLFSEFFFRKHEILKNYSVFEQLNRMGKLLLIFDGFDEMAARVNRQAMIDNFWELAKVVVPGAKAILTCRTEHFPNAMEGRQLLGAELESSTAILTGETPQFEVLELEKFEDEQIAQLLNRKATASTVEEVMGNEQLLDLARRPVMVDLILEALPDIEAGKPVDMARVYLYAVKRKMKNDIKSERTFTSLADKLYFLCELSWEMLSTDQMSLNYRAFPERLKQMFANRVKKEKELDHWRYDMMAQTMLIRNSEGDYSPAHRSLLEFFVAYKIVASLGAMAEDFTAVAQEQSHLNEALPSLDFTWDGYFKRECSDDGQPVPIAKLGQFVGLTFDRLLPLIGQTKLEKAVVDLAHPMLDEIVMRERLIPLLQETASKTLNESGYIGGNIAQLMLSKNPYALIEANLSKAKLRGIDFTKTYLRRVNLEDAHLTEVPFSKVLDRISSIAYSPNGFHLAIGDDRGTLQVWDITAKQVVLFRLGHLAAIRSVAYSMDGNYLATASNDKTVKLWNSKTGDCLKTLEDHESLVLSVAYSSNGKQLATASDDNLVRLWDTTSGQCTHTLEHEKGVWAVAYRPDGEQLASGGNDNLVRLWDTTSGQCTHTLEHEKGVWAVAYRPDGEQLASGGNDNLVRLWNTTSGKQLRILQGHMDRVSSLNYAPGGQRLISGSDDRTMKLWNVDTGECFRTFEGHWGRVWSVVYSLDEQQLASASADRTVKLWNPTTGECTDTLQCHESYCLSVAYSRDKQQLASSSSDKTVKLWNLATGECTDTLQGHGDWVWSVVYRPDGKQIASSSDDGTVKLWNPTTGECTDTLKINKFRVWSTVYSPNGKQLASSSRRTVTLWDPTTGECTHTLQGHEDEVRSIAYSPDGRFLASSGNDKTVKLWNPATGECTASLQGHEDLVLSVIYRPDGNQLASAGGDNTVKLWNPETGKCTATLQGHKSWVSSVIYSPDGTQLASGDTNGMVKLWDLATGKCIVTCQGHEDLASDVVYSPDGQQLASGSYDGTIRIWEINTGKCLHVIDDRVCAGLNITNTIGLTPGQRTALKLMGAVDHNDES